MINNFTFVDLFSGIGGFRIALENNGGKCIGFSEIDVDAIKTYCRNSNHVFDDNFGDITKIKSLPNHNLLTAGVPCQSWSIAGKNLGFDDDRGQLWNDTLYLLNHSRPDAFIFENVKGLVDPRNKSALDYIMKRIKDAGYFANYFVLNSLNYGVPQNRERIYIIGFKDKKYYDKFEINKQLRKRVFLKDILVQANSKIKINLKDDDLKLDLFGDYPLKRSMSLSSSNGFNDYFLFNDLRNGNTTIHSWDLIDTTELEKDICYLLLKNRRSSKYGCLDGNPLSLKHFQEFKAEISQSDLDGLVKKSILKRLYYSYSIQSIVETELEESEVFILEQAKDKNLIVDELKLNKELKKRRISITSSINSLVLKGVLVPFEIRYDFKNTKISTGLNGINRIILPNSEVFPTLVASDSNDFLATKTVEGRTNEEFKANFLKEIYHKNEFRKITKEEACLIQGFPKDFDLPDSRSRWMKLLGNSVSVPVIDVLIKSILSTGVFSTTENVNDDTTNKKKQLDYKIDVNYLYDIGVKVSVVSS